MMTVPVRVTRIYRDEVSIYCPALDQTIRLSRSVFPNNDEPRVQKTFYLVLAMVSLKSKPERPTATGL